MSIEVNIIELELCDSINAPNDSTSINLIALYKKFTALQRQNAIKWSQKAKLCWCRMETITLAFFIIVFVLERI